MATLVKVSGMLPLPPQVAGFTTVPTVMVGVSGCALMVTLVAEETQPALLLAVTEYVAGVTPVKIPVVLVYVEPSIL